MYRTSYVKAIKFEKALDFNLRLLSHKFYQFCKHKCELSPETAPKSSTKILHGFGISIAIIISNDELYIIPHRLDNRIVSLHRISHCRISAKYAERILRQKMFTNSIVTHVILTFWSTYFVVDAII